MSYISNWWNHYNSSSRFIGWFPQQQDEIKCLSGGLPLEWLTEGLPTWLFWLRNGIKLYCNETDWITTKQGTHMIFSHGDWNLSTKERTSFNLGKFQTCVSSSAQVLLLPNLPWRFGFSFQAHLCWLEAQLLYQVSNRFSLADSESLRAAQQRLGRQSVPAWSPLARSV